jgi:UDP-N-acetylmuramate dehydrogenase
VSTCFSKRLPEFDTLPNVRVQRDVPIAPHTSYRIGGPAALWVVPETEAAVGAVLVKIHAAQAPFYVLGRGSNVLVSDKGWPGVILYIGENLSGWSFEGAEAVVKAGTRLLDFIHAAAKNGLAGMESMAGIPGGVGGALRMNAGAFGQEIASTVREVGGFDRTGHAIRKLREEISFEYRRVEQLEKMVITSARFRFTEHDAFGIQQRIREILALRAGKQPLHHPSCGSVFKRPAGYFAGALIEESGLKGERVGGAEVSDKHGGFIINKGGARAGDVYRLIRRIETRVFEKFGVQLEREVQLVGEFDD